MNNDIYSDAGRGVYEVSFTADLRVLMANETDTRAVAEALIEALQNDEIDFDVYATFDEEATLEYSLGV